MPIMFAHFVYALLGFGAREFPAKSKKTLGNLSLTEGRIYICIIFCNINKHVIIVLLCLIEEINTSKENIFNSRFFA